MMNDDDDDSLGLARALVGSLAGMALAIAFIAGLIYVF